MNIHPKSGYSFQIHFAIDMTYFSILLYHRRANNSYFKVSIFGMAYFNISLKHCMTINKIILVLKNDNNKMVTVNAFLALDNLIYIAKAL